MFADPISSIVTDYNIREVKEQKKLRQTQYFLKDRIDDDRSLSPPQSPNLKRKFNYTEIKGSTRATLTDGKRGYDLKEMISKKGNKLMLQNVNANEVNRAAWPNYVGTTPALDKSPKINFNSTMLKKNYIANDRARSLLHSKEFLTAPKFEKDVKNDRRIRPNEYRGTNMSHCMYDTA